MNIVIFGSKHYHTQKEWWEVAEYLEGLGFRRIKMQFFHDKLKSWAHIVEYVDPGEKLKNLPKDLEKLKVFSTKARKIGDNAGR